LITRLAFFLSGHGFGHGVRNAALIEALPREVEVTLFTSLPEAFFREELHRPWRLAPCEIDCGCLQTSTVDVDVDATLACYAEIESRREEHAERLVPLLREARPDLVIGDIPPLAFPLAKAAGIPSWSLCNFTWLDIYRPYVESRPRYRDMLRRMEEDYAQADRRLRLYPYMDGEALKGAEDAGMLCRPGTDRRAGFAERFGLDPRKKWALVYVGSYGLEGVAWGNLARYSDWEFMGLYPLEGAPANYRLVRKDPSFRYADLTASCDLVLGKLGYGLVTECLSQAKPVLFLGRKDFDEFHMLKSLVEGEGLGREITLDAFRRVDIGDELRMLTAMPREPRKADGLGRILAKLGFPAPEYRGN
jgi:L-arabinokinase